jgi:predicted Zn-dependent peptidase
MSRETIEQYWARRYTPQSTVIAVAGSLPDGLMELVTEQFASWGGSDVDRGLQAPNVEQSVRVRTRETEQAHIVFGCPSISRDDDRRFALTLLDHVLGRGMSSRLFHEIRELRGLAYAVHAFRLPFADAGASAIYVGTTPSQTDEVMKIIRDQLEQISTSGITEEELERAKGHAKGALALGLEDPNSWMNRIGRTEITGMEHVTVDETVERLSAVTRDEIREVAGAAWTGPYVMGAVGPFTADDLAGYVT